MRVPLGVNLESRDGAVDQDAKVKNGIIEQKSETEFTVRKRPGMTDHGAILAGTAQMLYYFNSNVISITGGSSYRSTFALSSTLIEAMYTQTVTSISRSGSTATVTLFQHPYTTGDSVTISGAVETDYNGTFTLTVTGLSTFTYTVPGAPSSPATGTITSTGNTFHPWDAADNGLTAGTTGFLFIHNRYTGWRIRSDWNEARIADTDCPLGANTDCARGIEFLDGYFFIMDPKGIIWNSELDADPSAASASWLSTSFVTAEKENGAGVYLGRTLDYIVALKEWSTELFYNAGNPSPGSPLSPVDNGYFQVGCADDGSVARVEGSLFWLAQAKEKGRSVYMMNGLERKKVSTPDVERILNADTLATVHAMGFVLDGHALYVLTLVASNITLAYDATADKWTEWSSYTVGSSSAVTSITRSGTTATVTMAGHGLSDGDPVLMAGAAQSEYNGIFQIAYVSSSVFTMEVTGSPATPATGSPTRALYTESYFKFTKYANGGGRDLLLHESDGHLYELSSSTFQDDGVPINVFGRTIRLDGDDLETKKLSRISLIGDKASDTVMVRWSDDDCNTFSAYRRVDLSKQKPMLRRCGSFNRRTLEFRHVGNTALRLASFELGVAK